MLLKRKEFLEKLAVSKSLRSDRPLGNEFKRMATPMRRLTPELRARQALDVALSSAG